MQWCIAKNGGGYTQTSVAKGLKVPSLFMIAEVRVIRSQKKPRGWYTAYTHVYPPIHHWLYESAVQTAQLWVMLVISRASRHPNECLLCTALFHHLIW